MNSVVATGWLIKDSWLSMQPGSGLRFVCFDLMVANPEGEEPAPWRCEMSDLTAALDLSKKLVPGAGLIVQGELRARSFVKHGVKEGFTRYISVARVEFSRVIAQQLQASETPEPVNH